MFFKDEIFKKSIGTVPKSKNRIVMILIVLKKNFGFLNTAPNRFLPRKKEYIEAMNLKLITVCIVKIVTKFHLKYFFLHSEYNSSAFNFLFVIVKISEARFRM